MNHSLGIRNAKATHRAEFNRNMSVDILSSSIAETWTAPGRSDQIRDHLDSGGAISGDDMSRINYFEPADRNLKPIGEQRGFWSDVRNLDGRVAS